MAKHNKQFLVATEYIGWTGVFLIMLAYILLSMGVIEGQSFVYQASMLLGSGGIAFEAWQKRDRQPMVLNLIFVGIAAVTIVRLFIIH